MFALLALVVHVVLFVAIRSTGPNVEPQPSLTGKFVKRRPVRQETLERHLTSPVRPPSLQRAVAFPGRYARPTPGQWRAPSVPRLVQTRRLSAAWSRQPFEAGYGVPSTGRLRARPAAVALTAGDHVDLGLELLDAGALDTGKYRAVVVRDPADPQRLRGFVHLAAVGIRSAEQAAERSTRYLEKASYLDNGSLLAIDWRPRANVRALAELAGELGARTQLTATVDGDEHLEDTGWMDTPFVLLTAAAEFEPTSVEVEHLGQYLAKGGFAYVEVVGHASREAERYGWLRDLTSLRSLVEKALTSQGLHPGRDWTLRRLDLSHPLFTSYQAIGSLPRPYWSTMQAVYSNGYREPLDYPGRFGWSSREQPYLEGIFVRGRLAGIYSKQNYRDLWARRIEAGLRSPDPLLVAWYGQNLGNRSSGDAALRVGINIVVYALTQEGSLARQYVATRAVGGAPR